MKMKMKMNIKMKNDDLRPYNGGRLSGEIS